MTDSPCNGICQLHPQTGLCRGCGRTGAEIGAWGMLGRAERLSIMRTLPARMSQASMEPAKPGKRRDAR
ncbi:DUF1289 domain-containing protein [Fulvimarina sp. 2208YS6-2-32]|uniref:DUF1289 domain-containing protein n=1 Tax=Fulvimarina uroteuthidis TaxID=3098149 RepID=A0ABU5I3S0_9HYPH|nr:DUF1289 domain-containing protein [Fulvimarina sp. 2208YS6-2-32]MDY8110026.1 DUF1289 domain-containing protein [Fulvimarina sp. 2208YS6-2-32]